MKPEVHAFFHPPTNTVTYLAADPARKKAAADGVVRRRMPVRIA